MKTAGVIFICISISIARPLAQSLPEYGLDDPVYQRKPKRGPPRNCWVKPPVGATPPNVGGSVGGYGGTVGQAMPVPNNVVQEVPWYSKIPIIGDLIKLTQPNAGGTAGNVGANGVGQAQPNFDVQNYPRPPNGGSAMKYGQGNIGGAVDDIGEGYGGGYAGGYGGGYAGGYGGGYAGNYGEGYGGGYVGGNEGGSHGGYGGGSQGGYGGGYTGGYGGGFGDPAQNDFTKSSQTDLGGAAGGIAKLNATSSIGNGSTIAGATANNTAIPPIGDLINPQMKNQTQPQLEVLGGSNPNIGVPVGSYNPNVGGTVGSYNPNIGGPVGGPTGLPRYPNQIGTPNVPPRYRGGPCRPKINRPDMRGYPNRNNQPPYDAEDMA